MLFNYELWESMFCCTLLYVHSSIAIILMGKRELVALLNLSSWCLVMVEQLFLAVPRGCLRFAIVVFPDHTHLPFFMSRERYIIFVSTQVHSGNFIIKLFFVLKEQNKSLLAASGPIWSRYTLILKEEIDR